MAALCARFRAGLSPLNLLPALLIAVAVAEPAAATPNEPIIVSVDQAKLMQLPDRASTVVVGNPLIADLTIQPSGLAVITAKGYGATNFIVLDKTGAVLTEKTVEVQGPTDDTVVVYSGPTRQTYSCTPNCSPRITLGDSGIKEFDKDTQIYNDFFNGAVTQAVTRNTQAINAGQLTSGH